MWDRLVVDCLVVESRQLDEILEVFALIQASNYYLELVVLDYSSLDLYQLYY